MNAKYDIQLLVKVAQMYYLYGYKQSDIAKELKVSRSAISFILTEAKERGIVEIKYHIKNPLLNHDELSKQLESLFNTNRCIVIPSSKQDSKIATKLAAERAGDILNEEIHRNSVVGIAWGSTCYEFMSSYRPIKDLKNVSVVPLIGGSDKTSYKYQLNEMVRIFAEKVNGVPIFIHAPAIPASIEDKNLYMQSISMQSVISKWQSIEIAIISAGAPPGNENMDEDRISVETKAMYEADKTKAVGDICARHFNIHGEFIKDKYNEKVIGIPVEDLKRAKKVICAAAGVNKALSIIGALRTGIIDTFICDEYTAKIVVNIMQAAK